MKDPNSKTVFTCFHLSSFNELYGDKARLPQLAHCMKGKTWYGVVCMPPYGLLQDAGFLQFQDVSKPGPTMASAY